MPETAVVGEARVSEVPAAKTTGTREKFRSGEMAAGKSATEVATAEPSAAEPSAAESATNKSAAVAAPTAATATPCQSIGGHRGAADCQRRNDECNLLRHPVGHV